MRRSLPWRPATAALLLLPLIALPAAATARPTNTLAVVPGDRQVSIDVAPPASDGGTPLLNYEYSLNDGATWIARIPASTASPLIIGGLVNGVSYRIRVRAVNAAGAGPASVLIVVGPGAPLAPRSVTVTPGEGQLTVQFAAPPADGRAPTVGYEYSIDGGNSWADAAPVTIRSPGEASALGLAVIGGLVNGMTYSVRVRGVNAAGRGTASDPVIMGPGLPLGLTGVTFGPGDGRVSVGFNTPAADGRSTISGYEYSINDGRTWVSRALAPVPALTITGLVNGVAYPIRVRAVNAAGAGPASESVVVTPRSTPEAPSSVSAAAGDGQLLIRFSPPARDGGAPITRYEYSTNDGVTWRPHDSLSTPAIAVSDLVNGTTYRVKVRAVNIAGAGPASGTVVATPRTTPGAPGQLRLVWIDGRLSATWAPPSVNGGTPLTGHLVRAYAGEVTTESIASCSTMSATTCVIEGLAPAQTWFAEVCATNAAGATCTTRTPSTASAPSPPGMVSATPGDGRAFVAFLAPATNGGAPITSYEYSVNNGASWETRTPAGTSSPLSIGGLVNGVTYTIRLRAVNAVGSGAVSEAATVTPRTLPGAPALPLM